MADLKFLEQLTKKLADEGKLIESGWVAMRLQIIHPNATPEQLREMRLAYMAGAQHVFSSIMNMLDPGVDATEADLTRMKLVDDELRAFTEELKAAVKAREARR